MAAKNSVVHEPLGWLQEQLESACPDLLRAMVASFAQALMGPEAARRRKTPFSGPDVGPLVGNGPVEAGRKSHARESPRRRASVYTASTGSRCLPRCFLLDGEVLKTRQASHESTNRCAVATEAAGSVNRIARGIPRGIPFGVRPGRRVLSVRWGVASVLVEHLESSPGALVMRRSGVRLPRRLTASAKRPESFVDRPLGRARRRGWCRCGGVAAGQR